MGESYHESITAAFTFTHTLEHSTWMTSKMSITHHRDIWCDEGEGHGHVTAKCEYNSHKHPENIFANFVDEKTKDRGSNCWDDVHQTVDGTCAARTQAKLHLEENPAECSKIDIHCRRIYSIQHCLMIYKYKIDTNYL